MPALPARVQTPEPTRPRIDTIRMIHPSVAEMRSLVGERAVGRFPDREWIVMLPPGSTEDQVKAALRSGNFEPNDAGTKVFVSPRFSLSLSADEVRSLLGTRMVSRRPCREWTLLLPPEATAEQARMAVKRGRFELRDDGQKIVITPKVQAFDLLAPQSETLLK